MESALVFGPGDLRGEPYRLDDEKRRLVWRMYEVYPKDHPNAGRRRFRRIAISLRKGSAKSEFGAALCAVELHPEAEVRCDGWERVGREWIPKGRPMRDPYIPLLAYTEEQSEELAYSALLVMLSEGRDANLFDFGLQRIMRRTGDGKAAALATAPDSRDGARTTMELFDETHRLALPRQKEAHRTMLANLPKRKLADAWSLEVTTAPAPGEHSVAEDTMDYARQVADGAKADARLFFFHRQASDGHDLTTHDGVRAAVVEASGPITEWSDIDGIVEQWDDPTADRAYLARVWLNMLVQSTAAAFDAEAWKLLERSEVPADKTAITLGFHGARTGGLASLVATEIASGFQWPLGIWDPSDFEGEIPRDPVDVAVDKAMKAYRVVRFYVDPPYWKDEFSTWQGKYGDKLVLPWETYRPRPMGYAVRAYDAAIDTGAITHGGDDPRFSVALGNCRRRDLTVTDEKGERLWTIQKERPESPHHIGPTYAGIISWEARLAAIADGALKPQPSYFTAATTPKAGRPFDDDFGDDDE